jgi:hypothetical protein
VQDDKLAADEARPEVRHESVEAQCSSSSCSVLMWLQSRAAAGRLAEAERRLALGCRVTLPRRRLTRSEATTSRPAKPSARYSRPYVWKLIRVILHTLLRPKGRECSRYLPDGMGLSPCSPGATPLPRTVSPTCKWRSARL